MDGQTLLKVVWLIAAVGIFVLVLVFIPNDTNNKSSGPSDPSGPSGPSGVIEGTACSKGKHTCDTEPGYSHFEHFTHDSVFTSGVPNPEGYYCTPFSTMPKTQGYQCKSEDWPDYDDSLCHNYGTLSLGASKNSSRGKYVGCHWAEKAGSRDKFCWGGHNSEKKSKCSTNKTYKLSTGLSSRDGYASDDEDDTPLCMREVHPTCDKV